MSNSGSMMVNMTYRVKVQCGVEEWDWGENEVKTVIVQVIIKVLRCVSVQVVWSGMCY